MNAASRTSPVHCSLAALHPDWTTVNGMAVAERISADDAARLRVLGLADFTYLRRTGIKGPHAAAWLAALGMAVPEEYNTWCELAHGAVIARLAISEFFIEDAKDGQCVEQIARAVAQFPPGVYPVLRQDAGFACAGARVHELFAQTCSFDFRQFDAHRHTVVMTSMAGVVVLLLRMGKPSQPRYRLWCDPTYAPYLWNTLVEIAAELGGGPVGAGAFTQPAPD